MIVVRITTCRIPPTLRPCHPALELALLPFAHLGHELVDFLGESEDDWRPHLALLSEHILVRVIVFLFGLWDQTLSDTQ